MAIAPPPPGRPLLEIVSCESNYNHVAIIYRCACSNNMHIRVYRDGPMYLYSGQRRYPMVTVAWVGERVRIESTCDCNAGCRFTREDGGSEVLEVIFKIPSAL